MPLELSAEACVRWIAANAGDRRRVFIPFGPAEPIALREAWAAAPETAKRLTIVGAPLASINDFDYAALTSTTRIEALIVTPEVARASERGAASVHPIHYSAIPRFLVDCPVDVAIAHCAPARADRRASLGLSADLTPAALQRARKRIVIINDAMPDVADSSCVAIDDFDVVVHCRTPLAAAAPTPLRVDADAIARSVSALVRDGDVVQIGIGKLPSAILPHLAVRKRLRVHSGLIDWGHLALLEAGALADEPGALTTGTAIGDADLYAAIAREPRLRVRPVTFTHNAAVLQAIENFVSINAALEADLFGQINAEYAGDRQIAGVGGMADFVRGAAASRGGRAIIAIQAMAKDGRSRIRGRLQSPAVTLSRADAPIIVTEFGVADLRNLDVEARAAAMIAIAPPSHRDALRDAWSQLRAAS